MEMTDNLPDLIGTEKQVAWATDIRNEILTTWYADINDNGKGVLRVAGTADPEGFYAHNQRDRIASKLRSGKELLAILDNLSRMRSAEGWITLHKQGLAGWARRYKSFTYALKTEG